MDAMILAQSTIETLLRLIGEERMPDGPALRVGMQLAMVFDRDTWARHVDLCLVGGDPLSLALRLRRAFSETPGIRIAIVREPGVTLAPLAALDDPSIVQDLVAAGSLPAWLGLDGEGRSRPGRDILERAVQDCAARFETSGVLAYSVRASLQAARDVARGEILLRLGCREEPVPEALVAEGPGGALLSSSGALAEVGFSQLDRDLFRRMGRPPHGRRTADLFIARHCEVLSGFLSPGFSGSGLLGTQFMEEEIGADLFHLPRRTPASVEIALELWQQDLRLAAHGPTQISTQGDRS